MKRQIAAAFAAGPGRFAAVAGLAASITAVAPATSPDIAPSLSAQPGPALILEDSVVLREPDDHQLGQPVSLISADDGSFLIADGYSNSVLHFDSRGRFLRTFGRKGEGPGEFRFVSYAGFVAGDVVGIGDDHGFELELFELRSGAHIGAVKMSFLVEDYVVRGDTVWFVGVNTEDWTALGSAVLDDLVAAASSGGGDGTILSPDRVDVPRIYVENDVVRGMLTGVALDVQEGVSIVGFLASPELLVLGPSGAVLDSLVVPVARRRGLPPEEEFLALGRGDDYTGVWGRISALVKVSRDSLGFIHTIHQESNYDPEHRQMSATFYVSSVAADGTQACPDTHVPTSDAGLAELSLQENRLLVLDQRLAGSGIRTVIRTFKIDAENCTGGIVGG